ncbi:hypothetical protein F7725_017843 [Dissostichus mawsoni]|uniref:IF rod domain-containing protein n=1 Tax=Dissostichus mawsoni TaxID=36200 RepID=A0A7J5XPR1_DISMA|nr:hypothetical protein F7725_017843 [Dissostichus mawsoni]
MELHKSFHLGDEKHQMLNLNRRLETYLSRVKLLEQENALLEKEIEAMREAEAQLEARKKLEQSRKELEEEQRAQMWLRERVNQLEHEMMHLIQTHQEDLEETLNQSRSRLSEVNKEKKESEMKLRALEKEMDSARDVRKHLERNAQQQGDGIKEEIQTLQEHWESLEVEKEELSDHIDHLLLENRGLQQQKVALGLEVATYRYTNTALNTKEPLHIQYVALSRYEPSNIKNRDQDQPNIPEFQLQG